MNKKNINILKNSKDLALFLGMFAGDGCLSFKHNGDGYRTYPIRFYNTKKDYVNLFHSLFFKLFEINGKIRSRKREGRKELWEFEKYSKEIYTIINKNFEIFCGKKALNVKIPSFILKGNKELKKSFFLGLLITDGSIRKKEDLMFHCASKGLIQNLNNLVETTWGFKKQVKRYLQKEKFTSYQLTLNKKESSIILSQLPWSHNLVLRQLGKTKVNLESG